MKRKLIYALSALFLSLMLAVSIFASTRYAADTAVYGNLMGVALLFGAGLTACILRLMPKT
ncbi:hypothetical protein LJC07_01625 [Christensenellaceae bacterium OttesenSCG-928-L17]|nr:hypothetical protein [Christensenellaceae bacterium OttesenSCG-928-L17]